MRLDSQQQNALRAALQGIRGDAYLFGSRVDAKKRGGDIDLLIFSREEPYRLRQQIVRRFMALCEEKLDVVVVNPDSISAEQKAFLSMIDKRKLEL